LNYSGIGRGAPGVLCDGVVADLGGNGSNIGPLWCCNTAVGRSASGEGGDWAHPTIIPRKKKTM